eukprot:5487391-Prymnesium_polylepis.1
MCLWRTEQLDESVDGRPVHAYCHRHDDADDVQRVAWDVPARQIAVLLVVRATPDGLRIHGVKDDQPQLSRTARGTTRHRCAGSAPTKLGRWWVRFHAAQYREADGSAQPSPPDGDGCLPGATDAEHAQQWPQYRDGDAPREQHHRIERPRVLHVGHAGIVDKQEAQLEARNVENDRVEHEGGDLVKLCIAGQSCSLKAPYRRPSSRVRAPRASPRAETRAPLERWPTGGG